jgi:hypothetical protein
MTGVEAVQAGKRLYRLVMGTTWKGKWKAGRGNHRTYPRGSTFLINPGQGWHNMVHDLSHYCHRQLHPGQRPHDGRGTHAFELHPKLGPACRLFSRRLVRAGRVPLTNG